MMLNLSLFSDGADLWQELESFLGEFDRDRIRKAFDFAVSAHINQRRASGEPFVTHPVWVAKVVAQLNIGEEAVVASLLHDCLEDSGVGLDKVAESFGDEVALLVAGVTDVHKKTKLVDVDSQNIEAFREFLFSSINDVRVLIIRLTEKLHNGFTLKWLTRERQINFAKRTFGLYSPVAEYVGLHFYKQILDDIAFETMYPDEYIEIVEMMEKRRSEEARILAEVRDDIEQMLTLNNVSNFSIEGRVKGVYSTYLKFKSKGVERLKDGVGIRIIADNVVDCYTILGLVHAKYKYLPSFFDDYISAPKVNGYRSIQTSLEYPNGVTLEVQIRTAEMHEFNEFGPASHIAYKSNKSGSKGYEWVRDLVSWKKTDSDTSNYTINVLHNYVYVFTPKGDIIQMPKGSTALDFAYKIHSSIGNRCIGVKINKVMGKLQTELKNGDFVEVLTTKKINANKDWLNFVTTSDAKENIRKLL